MGRRFLQAGRLSIAPEGATGKTLNNPKSTRSRQCLEAAAVWRGAAHAGCHLLSSSRKQSGEQPGAIISKQLCIWRDLNPRAVRQRDEGLRLLTETVSFVCAVALRTLCMHQASEPVILHRCGSSQQCSGPLSGPSGTSTARSLTRELASLRELPKPQDGDVGRLLRHWLPNVVLRDLAFHESLLTLPGREPIAAATSSGQDAWQG